MKKKIEFHQNIDGLLSRSVFSLEMTDHGYFAWHGPDLPEDHPMVFLKDLHLVDAETYLPMHAFANANYFLQEKKYRSLAAHLRCTEEEAKEFGEHYSEVEEALVAKYGDCVPKEEVQRFLTDIESFLQEKFDRLRPLCEEAMELLNAPTTLVTVGMPTEEDIYINGEWLPARVKGGDYISTGTEDYIIFPDRETAGLAAREYWQAMAENAPEEFACIVGGDSLVQWETGLLAGPGSEKVRSLEDWLDLYLERPEEHFAAYDEQELEGVCSQALADELGFENLDVVLYRVS